MREFVSTLSPRETRMLRWSAAAAAAALWFSLAWRDAWVLLLVPLIGAWYAFVVYRWRRDGEPDPDDDPDWL